MRAWHGTMHDRRRVSVARQEGWGGVRNATTPVSSAERGQQAAIVLQESRAARSERATARYEGGRLANGAAGETMTKKAAWHTMAGHIHGSQMPMGQPPIHRPPPRQEWRQAGACHSAYRPHDGGPSPPLPSLVDSTVVTSYNIMSFTQCCRFMSREFF